MEYSSDKVCKTNIWPQYQEIYPMEGVSIPRVPIVNSFEIICTSWLNHMDFIEHEFETLLKYFKHVKYYNDAIITEIL